MKQRKKVGFNISLNTISQVSKNKILDLLLKNKTKLNKNLGGVGYFKT